MARFYEFDEYNKFKEDTRDFLKVAGIPYMDIGKKLGIPSQNIFHFLYGGNNSADVMIRILKVLKHVYHVEYDFGKGEYVYED